jgi:serine/threonine protein kinase
MDLATLRFSFADPDYYEPLHRFADASEPFRPSAPPAGWRETARDVWLAWQPPQVMSPTQGWKVHVSATWERAPAVIDAVAGVCGRHGVPFKHLRSRFAYVFTHHKHADRAQSGKLCALFPPDETVARRVMDDVSALLRDEEGPYILTDRRYGDSTVVHYRYGAFLLQSRLLPDGTSVPQLRDGHGALVEDIRVPRFVLPAGISDPFDRRVRRTSTVRQRAAGDGPRVGDYRILGALAHSNAGGAYRAIDPSGRVVFVKEARGHTGLHWDRTTAAQRLRREYEVLRHLHAVAPGLAPEPLAHFRSWEHEFMVTEFIDGDSLHAHLILTNPYVHQGTPERFRAYADECRQILDALARALDRLHRLGYRFGDLNPRNVLVAADGAVRLIDFEACGRLGEPPIVMGAPGYQPVRAEDRAGAAVDDYGVDAVALAMLFPLHMHLQRNPRGQEHLRAVLAKRAPLPADLWDRAVRPYRDDDGYGDGGEDDLPGPDEVAADPLPHLHRLRTALGRELAATATPDDPERIWPTVPAGYRSNTWCVMYGAAGVLHALHHADLPVDPAAVRRLRTEALARRDTLPPGLFSGTAGIGWVLADLGHVEEASELLAGADAHPLTGSYDSWGGGAAGVGAAALALWARTGEQHHLDRAVRLGDRLCATGVGATRLDAPEATGLARGRAGIALFLHYLWRVTDEEGYLRQGTTLLYDELGRAVEVPGGGWGFRDDVADRIMPYLAVGSAGVGHVLTRYVAAGGAGDERLVDATSRVFTCADQPLTVEPGLCQGLAGLSYAFADHADHAGRDDPGCRRRSVLLATSLFAYAAPAPGGRRRFLGAASLRFSAELFSGAAGILLALDRILRGSRGQFFTLDHLVGGTADRPVTTPIGETSPHLAGRSR